MPAWANELADARNSASHVAVNLRHYLHEDAINGCLDDSGPLRDGGRSGLRIIDDRTGRALHVEGRLLFGKLHFPFHRMGHRILVAKEAVLDFARRHELPPPSWWSDATKAASQLSSRSPEELKPAPMAVDTACSGLTDVRQPSQPPGELRPAPVAMIIEKLRSEYDRAEAAGEKPPNVREVSGPVQLALRQKGYWASRRAGAEEFARRRWPPGKRRR